MVTTIIKHNISANIKIEFNIILYYTALKIKQLNSPDKTCRAMDKTYSPKNEINYIKISSLEWITKVLFFL